MSTVTYAALSFVMMTVLFGTSGAQMSCYSCTSDQSGTDVGSCRVASGSTTQSANCASCSTKVALSTSPGAAYVYSRNCETTASSQGCVNVPPTSNVFGTCYCNTSLCNSNNFLTVGTLSCYSCISSYPVDNGCGNNLLASGVGVYVVSGCTTCTKSVVYSDSGPVYTRGCGHQYITDYCGNQGAKTCSFTCTTSLCNSAKRLSSIATTTPLVGATIFSLVLFVTRSRHQ